MTSKLTLSIDSKVIESAKKYSKQRGQSVSKIVEDYLRKFTPQTTRKKKSSLMDLQGILGSVERVKANKESATELLGIAGSISNDFDYDKELFEILSEKHLK